MVHRHIAEPTLLKLLFTGLLFELSERETIALVNHYVLHHLLIRVFVFLFLDRLKFRLYPFQILNLVSIAFFSLGACFCIGVLNNGRRGSLLKAISLYWFRFKPVS